MKTIKPYNSETLIQVDDEDYDRLSIFSWLIKFSDINPTIPKRIVRSNGHGTVIERSVAVTIQAEIMKDTISLFDHKDRNVFNCQKHNLRLCDYSENAMNRPKQNMLTTSRFKGVSYHRPSGKFTATIQARGIKKFVGYFKEEFNAAQAYNFMAEEMHGEFAVFNQGKK